MMQSRQRAESSARLLLACLEKQGNPDITWETIADMEPALAKLVPLQRRVIVRRRDGLELLDAIRVFDADLAQELLVKINYPEFIHDMLTLGYEETCAKFIDKACSYAQAQRFYNYYA